MSRSSRDAWLRPGAGDLKTEVVQDVPEKGESLTVRALPARYSAQVSSRFTVETEGTQQVSRIDVASMEILQFAYGVIDPETKQPLFTEDEAREIAEHFGPAFKKVIEVIDRLSGVDKEAVKAAEERFPDGGTGSNGSAVADSATTGSTGGSGQPAVRARAGA